MSHYATMNATITKLAYCEVHPGTDAKVRYPIRYPDGSNGYYDGCYWCWAERPRAEKGIIERVPAYKRVRACVDCGASITPASTRCKTCGGQRAWVTRLERYGPHGAPR